MTRWKVFASTLVVCTVLCSAAAAEVDETPPVSATAEEVSKAEAPAERFQLLPFEDQLILLEKATGDSWILVPGKSNNEFVWKPIQKLPRSDERNAASAPKQPTDQPRPVPRGDFSVQYIPGLDLLIIKSSGAPASKSR